MGYKIVQAGPRSDFNRIADVVNLAYQKQQYLLNGVQRISPDEIEKICADPQKRLYLCLNAQKEICGTALLDLTEKDTAEIGLVSVLPSHQGNGLGSLLMQRAEAVAFKTCRTVEIRVVHFLQEKLLSYYERQGYKWTHRTIDWSEENKKKYVQPAFWPNVYFSIYSKEAPASQSCCSIL